MALLLRLYHLAQAAVTAYTGILSYESIRKVQTYEEMTEKAAKYSNIADHHLQTTRTTQAAGAVSVLSSFALSTYYLLFLPASSVMPTVLSMILTIGLTSAHSHISNYWRLKAKVPLPKAGDYNDAISTSNRMRQLLSGLALSWGVITLSYFLRWLSTSPSS